jgi:hypothetical protein
MLAQSNIALPKLVFPWDSISFLFSKCYATENKFTEKYIWVIDNTRWPNT